jgi:hypothetical protein
MKWSDPWLTAGSKDVTPSPSFRARDRRKFLKGGMFAVRATAFGAGLSAVCWPPKAMTTAAPITKGDIAILRFLQALETIEADLLQQYAKLGGTQDKEVSGVSEATWPIHRPCNSSMAT